MNRLKQYKSFVRNIYGAGKWDIYTYQAQKSVYKVPVFGHQNVYMSIKCQFLDTSKHDRLTATQQDKRMEGE